jgi:hypothetical protein
MTASDYVWAWSVYGVSVVGLLIVWWRLLNLLALPWAVKSLLRAVAFALLLFPFTVAEGYTEMAPGWLVWLLALLFEGTDQALRSGPTLLGVTLTVCALWLLVDWLRIGRAPRPPERGD